MIETLKYLLMIVGGILVFLIGGGLLLAIVPILFLWTGAGLMALIGATNSRRLGPESVEQAADLHRARLRNPQFGVLEAHFGAPVPESLRRLYRNVDLLEQEEFRLLNPADSDLDSGHRISRFLPADSQALVDFQDQFEAPLFPFAEDGLGDIYCVLIRGVAPDLCPVYFWDQEEATPLDSKIAESLDEFIGRPRRPLGGRAG